MKIKPPIFAFSYLLIGIILHHSNYSIDSLKFSYIGAIFILMGITMAALALNLFKKIKTTREPFGKPTNLVTSRIYKFTRNPMYLGVTLIMLGIALFYGSIPVLLSPIAFLLTMNFNQVPKEEKSLEDIFGKDYLIYKQKVRRWL